MKKERLCAALLAATMVIPGIQLLQADEQAGTPEDVPTESNTNPANGSGTNPAGDGTGEVTVPDGGADTGDSTGTSQPSAPTVQEIAGFRYSAEIQDAYGNMLSKNNGGFLSPIYVSLGEMFQNEAGTWMISATIDGKAIAGSLGYDLISSGDGYYTFSDGQWTPVNLPVLILQEKASEPVQPEPDPEPELPAPTQAPTPEELGLTHYGVAVGPGAGLGLTKPGTVTITDPQTIEGRTVITATIDASQYPIGSRLPLINLRPNSHISGTVTSGRRRVLKVSGLSMT